MLRLAHGGLAMSSAAASWNTSVQRIVAYDVGDYAPCLMNWTTDISIRVARSVVHRLNLVETLRDFWRQKTRGAKRELIE